MVAVLQLPYKYGLFGCGFPAPSAGYSSLPSPTMSQYPVPPPTYGSAASSPKSTNVWSDREAHDPLLGSSSRGAGGIYDQPAHGDLPDDFKVPGYLHILFPFL